MKKFVDSLWQWGLTLLLGLSVFLFWWKGYPHALSYQEQFQLFLLDGSYLSGLLALPGGFARWLSEFLVQFYNVIPLGAALLAVLAMLVQRLTWRMMPENGGASYPLSFLPALSLWFLMGDESVLLSFAVALVLAQLLMLAYPTHHQVLQWCWMAVGIPVYYWLAGPMVMAVALYAVLRQLLDGARRSWSIVMAFFAVVCALSCILISPSLVPYPLNCLFCGLFYYRFVATVTVMMVVTALLVVAVPLVVRYLPEPKQCQHRRAVVIAEAAVLFILALVIIPQGYDRQKYDLIEYDYLVRLKAWDRIIAKSERQSPNLPMSVSANNLALAMKGQLLSRCTQFYQHGSQGLLPPFERNFTTAQLTGEIYFHLGLVNTAQRFAFESMEALSDSRKSVRAIKRLAETNLINGHYEVSRKYLGLLKETIFYRLWAERTEQLLGNEKAINAHPVYGWLRKIQLKDDFLFSEDETDKICGQLFLHNPENVMAMQYLLAHPLLDGDMSRFRQYQQVVESKTKKQ